LILTEVTTRKTPKLFDGSERILEILIAIKEVPLIFSANQKFSRWLMPPIHACRHRWRALPFLPPRGGKKPCAFVRA
jgi:hypothetical protein